MNGMLVPVECLLLAMVANKQLLQQLEERNAMLAAYKVLMDRSIDNFERAIQIPRTLCDRIVELEAMLKAKEEPPSGANGSAN